MSSGNKNICVVFVLVLAVFSCFAKGQTLTLVSARDHILGSFVGNQSVYADKERIYAGSFQGDLFVLERKKDCNFPLIESISFGASLVAVQGDEINLYVLTQNGKMWTFKKEFPLQFTSVVNMSGVGAESLALVGKKQMYASTGQGEMIADENCLYLSPLNEGDVAFSLRSSSLGALFSSRLIVYGRTFIPNTTTVYNIHTGAIIGAIANPIENQSVALYGDKSRVFQTVPGPFGTGIWIYNKSNLELDRFLFRPGTNTVTSAPYKSKDLLLAGNEGGQVDLFNLSLPGSQPIVSCANLRVLTGHNGSEDIEIRALWYDGIDGLVFAGSSWGNASSQGPELPSLFVLEVR